MFEFLFPRLWRWRGPVTDSPRSSRSGWMSCTNWELMWKCVTWSPLEPEGLLWSESTGNNWPLRLPRDTTWSNWVWYLWDLSDLFKSVLLYIEGPAVWTLISLPAATCFLVVGILLCNLTDSRLCIKPIKSATTDKISLWSLSIGADSCCVYVTYAVTGLIRTVLTEIPAATSAAPLNPWHYQKQQSLWQQKKKKKRTQGIIWSSLLTHHQNCWRFPSSALTLYPQDLRLPSNREKKLTFCCPLMSLMTALQVCCCK